MLFSVVVPTCHRNDLLAQCLQCLAPGAQEIPSEDYEVIVTDDGVNSTAEEMIRESYPWARWHAGPRLGPAANRNHGASLGRGEWLVFVDDDCRPDAQLLRSYARARVDYPGARVFEGRIYVDRPQRTLAECAPINEEGGYLWACNFAIVRALFTELGGFDERFRFAAMEDVELRHRLEDSGCTIPFIRAASVCHPWRPRYPVKEVQRHRASLQVFITLRPEKAPQFSFRAVLLVTLRQLLKVTLPIAVRLRGAGLPTALTEHAYTIYAALVHPLKPLSRLTNSGA